MGTILEEEEDSLVEGGGGKGREMAAGVNTAAESGLT